MTQIKLSFGEPVREKSWYDYREAVAGHRQGLYTIVDMGPRSTWEIFQRGQHVGTICWEGRFGTPTGVPCISKDELKQGLLQLKKLGIEEFSEFDLRGVIGGRTMDLSIEQMLKVMNLEGSLLTLPQDISFSKDSYQRLKTVLMNAGATYSKSAFAFDGEDAAAEAISQLLEGNRPNLKKSLQYFPTPVEVAERLFAGVALKGKTVLEPEAGEAALVTAAFNRGASTVLASEIYEEFHSSIKEAGAQLIGRDIFDLTEDDVAGVEVVVMNPPFSNGQDVAHVEHLLRILPENAEIHAIMSGAILSNSTKAYESFRAFMGRAGVSVETLEAGAFKESGTMAKSCIVRIPDVVRARLAA